MSVLQRSHAVTLSAAASALLCDRSPSEWRLWPPLPALPLRVCLLSAAQYRVRRPTDEKTGRGQAWMGHTRSTRTRSVRSCAFPSCRWPSGPTRSATVTGGGGDEAQDRPYTDCCCSRVVRAHWPLLPGAYLPRMLSTKEKDASKKAQSAQTASPHCLYNDGQARSPGQLISLSLCRRLESAPGRYFLMPCTSYLHARAPVACLFMHSAQWLSAAGYEEQEL